MQTFFIAPTDFGVGLTSISLGLVRTLERAGLKVGFFKPIAQPHPGDTGPERSTELVARTHGLKPPQPLGLAHVERFEFDAVETDEAGGSAEPKIAVPRLRDGEHAVRGQSIL